MKKLKAFWESLAGTTTIGKRELFFGVTTGVLTGILLGMFFSPKKHVMIGSKNSGNGCNCSNKGLSFDEEEWDDTFEDDEELRF